MSTEIATTIYQQLGGGQFRVMTGAKNLVAGPDYLLFRLSGTMTKGGINCVKVSLNGLDLYDVEYLKIRGVQIKEIAKSENIYFDKLRGDFESTTGLRTSLTSVYRGPSYIIERV